MLKRLLCSFLFISFVFISIGQNNTTEQLAAQYFQNGEFEKAAELYDDLYEKNPTAYYYNNLFQSLIKINNYSKAEKLLRKRLKQLPTEVRLNVELGYLYSISGDDKKAAKQYQSVIDNLSNNQQFTYDIANAFINRQLYDYAIDTYLKARKISGNNNSFSIELAMLYELRGRISDMMDEYLNLVVSDVNYLNYIQTRLQVVLNTDKDSKRGEIIKTAIYRRAQKSPENGVLASLMMWYSLQIKDFELAFTQAKAIDRRFKDNGSSVFELAELCSNNNDFDVALAAYQYLIDKGEGNLYFISSKIGLLNTKYKKVVSKVIVNNKELENLEKEYIKTLNDIGRDANTILLMKNLAHIYAFYSQKINQAITVLNEAISIPNADKKNVALCKLELADIYLFSGEIWEATLLYSQVEKSFKNDAIGFEAKLRNAKLSYYIGEFNWAKAQLDVLKAATSKLIANDAMELSLLISDNLDEDSNTVALEYFSRADLLLYRNQFDKALLTLDSIRSLALTHPIFDDVLFKKAEIKIKNGQYKEADSLLQKFMEFYPESLLADDALFFQAELNENYLNNKIKAMICYQDLIFKYPASLYTVEARKRFRKLRGDQIN